MSKTYRDYPEGFEFAPPDYRPKHKYRPPYMRKEAAERIKRLIDIEVRLLPVAAGIKVLPVRPLAELDPPPLQEFLRDSRLDLIQSLGEQMLYENPAA
jgi:hypothetical protein